MNDQNIGEEARKELKGIFGELFADELRQKIDKSESSIVEARTGLEARIDPVHKNLDDIQTRLKTVEEAVADEKGGCLDATLKVEGAAKRLKTALITEDDKNKVDELTAWLHRAFDSREVESHGVRPTLVELRKQIDVLSQLTRDVGSKADTGTKAVTELALRIEHQTVQHQGDTDERFTAVNNRLKKLNLLLWTTIALSALSLALAVVKLIGQ